MKNIRKCFAVINECLSYFLAFVLATCSKNIFLFLVETCTWFCTFDAPFMFSWKFNHNTLIYLIHMRLLFHWNMKMCFAVSLIMFCTIIYCRCWTTMCLEVGFKFCSFLCLWQVTSRMFRLTMNLTKTW